MPLLNDALAQSFHTPASHWLSHQFSVATQRALDSKSDRGCYSRPGAPLRSNPMQVTNSHLCASVTEQHNLALA